MTHDHDKTPHDDGGHDASRPARTATDEVLDEIEDAETDPLRDDDEAAHRGEGADATSPDVHAQEDVRGE